MKKEKRFLIGINYWPRETAMYWWKRFDPSIVKRDFSSLAEFRFDGVRIFLLWEDFQPEMRSVSAKALDDLVRVTEMAHQAGLQILPTFFCGHMSGFNWLPPWMLEFGAREERFPIISGGEIRSRAVRNMYTDREVWKAQRLLIYETTGALKGHPAILGWDLGNEPSNLVLPPSKDSARAWLEEMVTETKRWDENLPITLGLHQKDLEEDRVLGPREVGPFCDILSVHAYPGYAEWSDGPTDEKIPLFLGLLTRWLGGKGVLIEEFGLPTEPLTRPLTKTDLKKLGDIVLVPERDGEAYYQKVLELLRTNGFVGAFAWCYSDYDPVLWENPPPGSRVHERYFGLFRSDGSAKGAARVIRRSSREPVSTPPSWDWIDMEPGRYYENPQENLKHLYRNFRDRFQGI